MKTELIICVRITNKNCIHAHHNKINHGVYIEHIEFLKIYAYIHIKYIHKICMYVLFIHSFLSLNSPEDG
jgi:coproporphyrinogen III oxidase-like Fe-S oxidoreductase